MRYQIFYQKGGNIDIEILLEKMTGHKELFDNLFGSNNWTFTGSAAVVIYALTYAPDMVSMLDEPGDLDFLVKSKDLLTNKFIGDYNIRKQESLERSYTFLNSITNESIDVMSVPVLKKIDINGFPLLDISILLGEYTDAFLGVRDKDIKKVEILNKISSLVERPKEEDTRDVSHLDGIKTGALF